LADYHSIEHYRLLVRWCYRSFMADSPGVLGG